MSFSNAIIPVIMANHENAKGYQSREVQPIWFDLAPKQLSI
jgi:hypothetical protein